ncbi:MAG: alkaline phosphatase family protein [Vulcanimicrobiaceae bacterium]
MRTRAQALLRASALLVVAALIGCSGSMAPAVPAFTYAPVIPNSPFINSPIKHIVIIVQENRSFDNLFEGFPGADTASSGVDSAGQTIPLVPLLLQAGVDLGHFHYSFEAAYDGGRLDGFDKEHTYGFVGSVYEPVPGNQLTPYSYVPRSQIQPYWTLAQGYTLADRMFQSNNGPSYPAHQYLIAGQSAFADEVPSAGPWGCDAPPGTTVPLLGPNGLDIPGPFPCFNYETLADLLDTGGVSWRYYTPALTTTGGLFSAYDAIRHIRYGSDWNNNVISPETQVLSDVKSGYLPDVAWVIPSFPNSDHPLAASDTGPAWVASVVNAIGNSPLWNSTAIFITWDDWGGWYDNVVPPQTNPMGLGFRVPLIVVSPYAKHGYISHQQHDFGSILKFVEDNFGLPSLGQNDATSDDLLDCFDFTQPIMPYHTVQTAYPASYFINEPHVPGPNDPA